MRDKKNGRVIQEGLDVMKMEDFLRVPVMGILRGIKLESIAELVTALNDTPLKYIEVTMDTDGAVELIRELKSQSKGCMTVGAGTVLNREELEMAIAAGAEFIVSPVLVKEVVATCVEESIPVFPGAFSPQEIVDAYQAGASMVKVFPCSRFGPEYIKELRGPFPDIPLLACGGVNADNVSDYFAKGATGIAFGGSIFNNELIANGGFKEITQRIIQIMKSVNESS